MASTCCPAMKRGRTPEASLSRAAGLGAGAGAGARNDDDVDTSVNGLPRRGTSVQFVCAGTLPFFLHPVHHWCRFELTTFFSKPHRSHRYRQSMMRGGFFFGMVSCKWTTKNKRDEMAHQAWRENEGNSHGQFHGLLLFLLCVRPIERPVDTQAPTTCYHKARDAQCAHPTAHSDDPHAVIGRPTNKQHTSNTQATRNQHTRTLGSINHKFYFFFTGRNVPFYRIIHPGSSLPVQ